MKKLFSTKWIASKQPRKQRKYRANAPLSIKRKLLGTNLAKSLREKYGRSAVIRKGDEVLVKRGSFKKKKAKVVLVDIKRSRVALEGLQRTKKDGTKVNVFFNPRALQIQTLVLDDKKRIASLTRSKGKEEKNAPEKTVSNN